MPEFEKPRVFLHSKQGARVFSGVAVKEPDNLLLPRGVRGRKELIMSGAFKTMRRFDPKTRRFKVNWRVPYGQFPEFEYPFAGLMQDVTLIPRDDKRGIVGGYAATDFLGGRIWTVLNDGNILQSNAGEFEPTPQAGVYQYQASFNADLLGAAPIAYRKSDDRLYVATFFNTQQLFKLNWRGSVPTPIALSRPVGMADFAFDPHDDTFLYSPDTLNDQIVRINVLTGQVKTILSGILFPIAVRIDQRGVLFLLSRSTGKVYKYNVSKKKLVRLATLQPGLGSFALDEKNRKLYVTNDQNKIFRVDADTGKHETIFRSDLVLPWDLALDGDSLYIADSLSLRQVNARSGKLERLLIIDSEKSGVVKVGQANGITVERDPHGVIILCDLTLGNIMVFDKRTLKVLDVLQGSATGLTGKEPFSVVRVGGFYLATNAVDGTILKIFPTASGRPSEVFFSGLRTPVKLKLHKGFLYVVEAGNLRLGAARTGRVSRIPLNNPNKIERLIDRLNNPQGFDIVGKNMYIAEVGNYQLLEASADRPSKPKVIAKNLKWSSALEVSQFQPINIFPTNGLAANHKGIYVIQSALNNIVFLEKKGTHKPCK